MRLFLTTKCAEFTQKRSFFIPTSHKVSLVLLIFLMFFFFSTRMAFTPLFTRTAHPALHDLLFSPSILQLPLLRPPGTTRPPRRCSAASRRSFSAGPGSGAWWFGRNARRRSEILNYAIPVGDDLGNCEGHQVFSTSDENRRWRLRASALCYGSKGTGWAWAVEQSSTRFPLTRSRSLTCSLPLLGRRWSYGGCSASYGLSRSCLGRDGLHVL